MGISRLALGALGLAGTAAGLRYLTRSRENMDWEEAPRPGNLAEVNGVQLHYVEAGDGPAVVMIHGFGGHTVSFRHTIPALAAAGYRALALDLKGFGYSERVKGGDYSNEEQARLVLGFMDAMAIERATLIGHSMGGAVAMRAAAQAPERVDRLVLAASVSGDRVRMAIPPSRMLRSTLPLLARLGGRRLFIASWYDWSRIPNAAFQEYRKAARIKGSLDGVIEMLKDTRKDPPIDFSRITHPVLILWAAAERVVPQWMFARLRQRFPRARVQIIPRAGHVLLEERPESCNPVILDFLADDSGRHGAVDTTPATA